MILILLVLILFRKNVVYLQRNETRDPYRAAE